VHAGRKVRLSLHDQSVAFLILNVCPPAIAFLNVTGWMARGSFLGLSESVALSIGFEDMDPVGKTVGQSSGEAFGTEDFSPVLKGETGRNHEVPAFVGSAVTSKSSSAPSNTDPPNYVGKLIANIRLHYLLA